MYKGFSLSALLKFCLFTFNFCWVFFLQASGSVFYDREGAIYIYDDLGIFFFLNPNILPTVVLPTLCSFILKYKWKYIF